MRWSGYLILTLQPREAFNKLKDNYGYISVGDCPWSFKDPKSFFWWIRGEDDGKFTKDATLFHERYVRHSIAKIFGCSTIVEFTEKIKNYILKGEKI